MRPKDVVWIVTVAIVLNAGLAMAQPKPKIAEVVRGSVELKRGGSDYRPVSVGEPLYSGDLLRVRRGSKAEIQCSANKTTWTVPDNGLPWGVANVCPSHASSTNRWISSLFGWYVR
ncbi:MAG: hypothetical protein K6T90_02035 [Leptolyngbyaceae cyanobacterium HOT.MB2.61]|nr:hypothetical protein [Leptolyngbyaceae cyanobacterium HOT.MB2.61]